MTVAGRDTETTRTWPRESGSSGARTAQPDAPPLPLLVLLFAAAMNVGLLIGSTLNPR